MNAQQYATALTTLSLTSRDVCAWLGVSRRGEALWRKNGPSNLAGRLIEMHLVLRGLPRVHVYDGGAQFMALDGHYVAWNDIAPLLAVGEGV